VSGPHSGRFCVVTQLDKSVTLLYHGLACIACVLSKYDLYTNPCTDKPSNRLELTTYVYTKKNLLTACLMLFPSKINVLLLVPLALPPSSSVGANRERYAVIVSSGLSFVPTCSAQTAGEARSCYGG